MEALSTKSLRDDTRLLLESMAELQFLSNFTLVDGTALAMYYQHRESVDLDLISFDTFLSDELLLLLEQNYKVERIGGTRLSLNLLVEGVKVDLINHPHPTLEEGPKFKKIKIASLMDIGAMKMNAVCGRGSKKDFVDIYFLLKQFRLPELVVLYLKKYPNTSELMALKSLSYFSDAEAMPMPVMKKTASWADIKGAIVSEVKKLRA